jgi:hypothetical protein
MIASLQQARLSGILKTKNRLPPDRLILELVNLGSVSIIYYHATGGCSNPFSLCLKRFNDRSRGFGQQPVKM